MVSASPEKGRVSREEAANLLARGGTESVAVFVSEKRV